MHALRDVSFSCAVGLAGGLRLHVLVRGKHRLNEILIVSLGVIFLTISAAIVLGLSLLIANMALGAVLVNLSARNRRVFQVIEPITPPIFALFFVLAGTELDIGVFSKGLVIIYGALYLVSRFIGKYMGAYAGALAAQASKGIRNYLGLCLFPQAGVAIGLVLYVQTAPVPSGLPEPVSQTLVLMVNVVLLSIFVNEIIGPSITRFGIARGADL